MIKKIRDWTIKITWDNEREEYISDMPDDVSQPVDDFLTELENERNEEEIRVKGLLKEIINNATKKREKEM